MIVFLRCCFIAVLAVMTWGTVRASLTQALFDIPPEVYRNPWFQVTLFDAYFAFLTFYVWIAWKERSTPARVLWAITVVLWGNFAMATYMLRELFAVKAGASLTEVITTPRPGRVALPAAFVVLGAFVYLLGAKNVLFG
jgi:hypothetical protein